MKQKPDLKARVLEAAEGALAAQQYVSPIDLLVGMNLLSQSNVDAWKKGRLLHLEEMIQGAPEKLAQAFAIFGQWVKDKGLKPNEIRYTRPSRAGAAEIFVTRGGNPEVERFFRTQYLSPMLPERKQQQIIHKQARAPEQVVFEVIKDSRCSECGIDLLKGSVLFMDAQQPLCLACANFDDLEFLPSGDTALTRQAAKHSQRKVVVVRFSRSRGRYERQGVLVEPVAIAQAEQECLEDAAARASARSAAALHRQQQQATLVAQLIAGIRVLFPAAPPLEVEALAAHSAARGSDKASREPGIALDEAALLAAVTAAARHRHTKYDSLVASGVERSDAREMVAERLRSVLQTWQK